MKIGVAFFLGHPVYFCYLGAHAKFRNPTTTPSGILVTGVRREKKINLPKIVAYLSLLRWSHALR